VVGAGVAAKTLAVAAEPDLAPRSAAQLLVDLQTASLDGLSGTVVERADLGLPAITSMLGNLGGPAGAAGAGSANLTSLITGKHTLRVWYSGPDKARVALVGTNGESDVIRNGDNVWIWDSKSNSATHHVFTDKEKAGKAGAPGELPKDLTSKMPKTPQEAADLALKAIDPTTVVSTGNSAKIAGRNAYELILSPRDTSSLIGQVRLAIDAKQHVPLRVQVLPKGSSQPAVEVGFTQVSFARPDDAQFNFTPPAGAKVTEADPDKAPAQVPGAPKAPGAPGKPGSGADQGKSTVIGQGWTAVFVARAGSGEAADASKSPEAQSLLNQLPKAANGGRVLTSKLFTVMLTSDGRILVGAVSPERLAQVAADPAAQLK
jgi:outer membrane lipoprotein-sorting protein